jgi:carbamoyl-phosphate synthase small subunit
MTGYQEILTDPSYAGQVVTMTYPLIGNYGINEVDVESDSVKVSGFIVKEYSTKPNHWQLTKTLDAYLIENNIVGVYDVDTRMLTKKIRNLGAMNCVITSDESLSISELEEQLKQYVFPKDIVKKVSIQHKKEIKADMNNVDHAPNESEDGQKDKSSASISIGIVDLGLKTGIVKQLLKRNVDVTIYPHNVGYDEIEARNHDGILFSNGPGDPKECVDAIKLANQLKGEVPLFGICLGHQILALSLGANTYKLKFGHRGSNHPVINLKTNKVFMTAQNHGYGVEIDSITEEMELTHLNVNDETVEGISSRVHDMVSVQFHPEEGPGHTDATVIFSEWINKLERNDS